MAPKGTPDENMALGYGKEITHYSATYRNSTKTPDLMYKNKNDRFTVTNSTYGNSSLNIQ